MMTKKRAVTLGVGGLLGHDANAALFVDGELCSAAQEERFTRRKHDGAFPRQAIADCLERAGLRGREVTDVVFAEKPLQSRLHDLCGVNGNGATRLIGRIIPEPWGGLYTVPARALFPEARFHYAWHHLSHVAGAFHTSGFSRSAFLCVDGKGEDYSASAGIIDTGKIKILWEQPYGNGLGMFYTLITNALGFLSFGSEYKVMGLAPYGRPNLVESLGKLYSTDAEGGFQLREPLTFAGDSLLDARGLVASATGVPVRDSDEPLQESHLDLAASLQKIFDDEILKMAAFVRRQTGEENILFCGGCAQNCVAAGRLRRAKIFPRVFNSPVGGDMGSGFGAALLWERAAGRVPGQVEARGFYLGSEPGTMPVESAAFRIERQAGLHGYVAREIAAGKIVAVVRGGMELGARALGARSILADPRALGMQSRLNLAVKFRESFRPFAPAILAEHVGAWFDTTDASDFMNYTAYLRPDRRAALPASFSSLRAQLDFPRCEIPSVIHVDFSARLQTVRPEIHPDLHHFILEFYAVTGVPILINTSFNVAGQPIVRTAAEGWDAFINTDIDLLVVNDEVYRNPHVRTRAEKTTWLAQFAKSA